MISIIEAGKTVNDMFDIETLGIRAHGYKIEPPQMRTNYVEIPGRNGSLDLTEALGQLTYNDRAVVFTALFQGSASQFHALISHLLNRFEGKTIKVVFDKSSFR